MFRSTYAGNAYFVINTVDTKTGEILSTDQYKVDEIKRIDKNNVVVYGNLSCPAYIKLSQELIDNLKAV